MPCLIVVCPCRARHTPCAMLCVYHPGSSCGLVLAIRRHAPCQVKLGTDKLSPGWTNHRKRVYYVRHELAGCLRDGENVLSATLGNGWFSKRGGQPGSIASPPQLLLSATIVGPGTSGSREVVTVRTRPGKWQAAAGPIVEDSLCKPPAHLCTHGTACPPRCTNQNGRPGPHPQHHAHSTDTTRGAPR